MINFGSENTLIKSKLINRRMFLASTAKAVVFCGIIGRLFSLQINENKKSFCIIKVWLKNPITVLHVQ